MENVKNAAHIAGNDRLSVPLYNHVSVYTDFSVDMFTEDISNYIVPFDDQKVNTYVEPSNTVFETIVMEILASSFSQYGREGLNQAVLDAIRYIAGFLARDGYVIFEFIKLVEADERLSYRFVPILGKVNTDGKSVVQKIPAGLTGEDSPEYEIIIPQDKCQIFEFPESLGGKKQYLNFLKKFKKESKSVPMMKMYSEGSLWGAKGYDISKHQQIVDLKLWKRTQPYGWGHREGAGKLFSSFFPVYRSLKFKHSQVLLRDHVIDALQKLIKFIGKELKQEGNLVVEGLSTLSDIESTIKMWETGELKINEISKAIGS